MTEPILGMKGLTLRNTFLEFKDEEDTLALDGFNRQASEPAKPPSMQQLPEQRGTTDGAFNLGGSMPSRNVTADPSPALHPPEDFQWYRESASDEHPSSMGMAAGVPSSVWEAALMAVQQSMAPLPSSLQPVPRKFPRTSTAAAAATAAMAARGPSFCPSCGSKVMDSSHRFCAYCCFPLKDLQNASMTEAHSVAAPPPDMSFPADLGLGMRKGMTLNPASVDLTAAALVAQQQALHSSQSIGNERRSTYPEQDNIMKSLRHFRYVDAKELDVEHAKAVCLAYLSASRR